MGKDDLKVAIKNGDLAQVQQVLQRYKQGKSRFLTPSKKHSLDYLDSDGLAPLHIAATHKSPEVLKALLDNGASPDFPNGAGETSLHMTSSSGDIQTTQLLLQAGVNVDRQDGEGNTPLHLATKKGHLETVEALLQKGASPSVLNKEYRTCLDVACEAGHISVVRAILDSPSAKSLLQDSEADASNNNTTTCLHSAAKGGHTEVLRILLEAGVDKNITTMRGTALHEAAYFGQLKAVQFLLLSGIDVNKPNSYEQTALDMVHQHSSTGSSKELKKILKEATYAVYARALRDHINTEDPEALNFREGETISVLDQSSDGRWKGIIFGDNLTSCAGYFPATSVAIVDRQGCPITKSKSTFMKKVSTPTIPESHRLSTGSCVSSGYGSVTNSDNRSSYGSVGLDDSFPPPPSPIHPNKENAPTFNLVPQGNNTLSKKNLSLNLQKNTDPAFKYNPQLSSLEDQGIEVTMGSGLESPMSFNSIGASVIPRNSTSSLDSGKASSSVYDGRSSHSSSSRSSHNPNRLSGHSYSSTSSQGSSDRLEEVSGCISQIHVSDLLARGMPDFQVLNLWLRELHLEEYYHLFLEAGYDIPTIVHMTPQDLSAIGITNPVHRQKLKSEISQLKIPSLLPDFIPDSLGSWFQLLGLGEYTESLMQQGYRSVDSITQLIWEDLEEIGICKLGHQKKLVLAIKRIKDIKVGKYPAPYSDHHHTSSCTQEVAIMTHCPPPSSRTAFQGKPEFTTFQVPHKYPLGYGTLPSCSDRTKYSRHLSFFQTTPMVEEMTSERGKSLESLSNELCYTQPSFYGEPVSAKSKTLTRSYEDSDVGGSKQTKVFYDVGYSGATLPRKREQRKIKPVAKIIAKTRSDFMEENINEIKEYPVSEQAPEVKFKRDDSSSFFSKSNSLQSKSWLSGFGTSKKVPPHPPKRSSCADRYEGLVKTSELSTFSSCVRGITSKLISCHGDRSDGIGENDLSPLPPPVYGDCEMVLPNKNCLPVLHENSPSDFISHLSQKDGLNGSNASVKSASSTESDFMPFANENAGTIKQRATRQHPSLNLEDSPMLCRRNSDPDYVIKEDMKDVLCGGESPRNWFDNMLEDLTDTLDAMLKEENA